MENSNPEQETQSPTPSVTLSSLSRDGTKSAFTPYKPSTELTNLQRGNVQTQTPVLPERTIHQLASRGELFEEDLAEEVDVDSRDHEGLTPLMWACCFGQIATVRLLLHHEACASAVGKMGETALMFASANGHAAIIKKLIKRKAKVDAQDCEGGTALMYASSENHALCVHELLVAGADLTLKNSASLSAYDIAIYDRSKQALAVLDKHMMNLLLAATD